MSDCNSIPLPTNRRFNDLTGRVFSRLTVIGYAGKNAWGNHKWLVSCECGESRETLGKDMVSGDTRSCGCGKTKASTKTRPLPKPRVARPKAEKAQKSPKVDLTGKVFGRLTVVGFAGLVSRANRWHVVCACGAAKTVAGGSLKRGHTTSCGCLHKELLVERLKTHGMRHSPEYAIWCGMWDRCTNPRNKSYPSYRDRTPPQAWRDFAAFYAEIGPRPSPAFSLDRIDNDKPYGPGNVRWVTRPVQNRNKSTNVWVTTPDGQRRCLTDACELIGVPNTAFYYRTRKGQTIEEASNGLLKEAA